MPGALGTLIRTGRALDALDAVPAELRELEQWVLYRAERRNGKVTKTPFCAAHPRRRASSTEPGTWSTFEAAVAAQVRGGGDGIGFVFTEADPYVGVDLDRCLLDGIVHPDARELVVRLGTYAEVSPSGTGLHALGRGQVGERGRRTSKTPWGGELEVYDRGRYFTVTGRRFADAPAELGDVDLRGVLELVEPANGAAPLEPRPLEAVEPAIADDRELLERAFAARNGAKFAALWQGDASGYGSESEADLALCSMLAFYTGPDAARVDRLFRSSGRARPKWDRDDYREVTIAKAINGKREFYTPPTAATLPPVSTPETALDVATAAIKMREVPLVAAREAKGGKVTLERADGLRLAAPSLESLAKFATLQGALVAQFGHELTVKRDEKTPTAHRFVAALRRHFGPLQVDALEAAFEGWLVDLVRVAGEAPFTGGAESGEGRLRVWQALDELDPAGDTRGADAFAHAVVLAHDLSNGDRYLRSGWAHEYVRRCGFRGSTEQAAGMLEAIGFEQPNPKSGGRVRAQWRAGGETLELRFWIIPRARFEAWRADS